jgi:hypothetical protein
VSKSSLTTADVLRDLPADPDIPDSPTGSDVPTARDAISAIDVIKRFAVSFEPGLYSGEDAKTLVRCFSELRHVATSLVMLAAKRVQDTCGHESEGHRTAGTFLATMTGESVGSAAQMLETARSIEAHPVISEAFRSGSLSEQKAKQIASAADARPDQAQGLLEAAQKMELGGLKRHCADVRQSALSEDDSVDRYEQMRKKRYCRMWIDQDGFGRLEARVTPDALAVLRSCLEPFEKLEFERARKEGRHEQHQVYAADALVAMAKASRSGKGSPNRRDTLVRVRVDLGALMRGHTIPGETCSIPGIGPLPVALVRQILGDCLLELLVTEGKDVRAICTNSRYMTRALRIALEERDETCCVPGCEASDPLEIDHRSDFAKGGETKLDNLARLCPFHHHQKTHKGWMLEGEVGSWRFCAPDPPPGSQHPEHLANIDFPGHRDDPAAPRNGAAARQQSKNGGAGATGDPTGSTEVSNRARRANGPPGQSTLL